MENKNSSDSNIFMWIAMTCALGTLTMYLIRAFHPEQPLHHELNDAGGVFLAAAFIFLILSFIFD